MLEGLLAPLRMVAQRSAADWLLVAATWIVILCATTLLAIGVLYGDAVAQSGLRQRLADEPIASTTVTVDMRVGAEELDAVDEVVARQSRRILGWADGELVRTVRSGSFDFVAGVSGLADTDLAALETVDGLADHARLVSGAWPLPGNDPLEATLPAATAERLGLAVGAVLSLASRTGPAQAVEVRIVGTWEPLDPGERYWVPGSLELTGINQGSSFALHGPLVITAPDLVERVATGKLEASWRTVPDFASLALDDVGWMRGDAAALERRIGSGLESGTFFSVSTGLPAALASADRSLLVSRSGVLLLTIQFAILAGYALVLVAGLLAEQRRIETALLRSRGATTVHVLWMSLLEGVLLVVPAVLLAPWVALAALQLFDVIGPLAAAGVDIEPRVEMASLLVAGGTGIACLVGLVLPLLTMDGRLAAVRQAIGRQGNRSLAQRTGVDVALVVLAGIGLWQLRQYGAPLTATVRGAVGMDPLLVAAPAIGLAAGAILALRIVPLLAELGERVTGRHAGLVGPLGARQLARRPLRYTRSALLVLLAAALGTFAAAYTSTWSRSQLDQAAYETGGDVRVEVSTFADLPSWALGAAYAAIDGVQAAMPVATDAFDVGGAVANGQIVAVDTALLAQVPTVRPDLLGSLTLGAMADALAPDIEGTVASPLHEGITTMALDLRTALESVPLQAAGEDGAVIYGSPLPDGTPIGSVSVAVRDASGLVHVLDASRRLTPMGEHQLIDVALSETLPDGTVLGLEVPLELIGIQVLLQPPPDTRIVGEIEISGLEGIGSAGESAPIDVAPDWQWLSQRGGQPPVRLAAGEGSGAGVIGERDAIIGDDGPVLLRFVSPGLIDLGNRPMAAIVSRSFSQLTGTDVGEKIAIGSLTRRTEIEVRGVIAAFPTMDPDRPFAVVDLGRFALASFVQSGQAAFVDEWWLRVSDEDAVGAVLSGDPYSVERLTLRQARRGELSEDPVTLGVVGALGIGAVAALILAVVGYAVSAAVSARERLGEFALLRAMGLSPRQLSAWLSMEFAFVLVVGTVIGSGLGILLAWLVLPFVTLTSDGGVAVPPVLVEVPWGAIAVIHLSAALALGMSVFVIGRVVGRVPVIGALRSGQD